MNILNIFGKKRQKPQPINTYVPSTPQEIRSLLREGKVHFVFKKKDGTLRTAISTTNLSNIPWQKHPQGVRESSVKIVPFFDLEAEEWRSMSATTECYVF